MSKLRGKFQNLKKKTQNSRKKLKLWEDFALPERPSGVMKIKSLSYLYPNAKSFSESSAPPILVKLGIREIRFFAKVILRRNPVLLLLLHLLNEANLYAYQRILFSPAA